jgi:catechol 2,3-dioxygenase-like lactoylglutathione lyase family enzyme
MLDHISIAVGDYARARDFYDQVLGALGHARVMNLEEAPDFVACGYGASEHEPAFWIGSGTGSGGDQTPQPPEGQHIAFRAPDRAAVDAFHAAGLAAGGTDNGAPGLRPHYHPNYYAAFIIDPDGNHLEAVCHTPG